MKIADTKLFLFQVLRTIVGLPTLKMFTLLDGADAAPPVHAASTAAADVSAAPCRNPLRETDPPSTMSQNWESGTPHLPSAFAVHGIEFIPARRRKTRRALLTAAPRFARYHQGR